MKDFFPADVQRTRCEIFPASYRKLEAVSRQCALFLLKSKVAGFRHLYAFEVVHRATINIVETVEICKKDESTKY